MTLADLTLLAPVNGLLGLAGMPRLALEHLVAAQAVLLVGDQLAAALPARRRRRRRSRGGGIGFFGLCCVARAVMRA